MNRKKLNILFVSILAIILILMIGPLDVFVHGYYCNVVDINQIETHDFLGSIDLGQCKYEMNFKPTKDHFKGFEIILNNQPIDNTGTLICTIYDKNLQVLDEINIDLSKIEENTWYKVTTSKSLKKNDTYLLSISAIDCKTYPYLQLIDRDYLTKENISGDILIGFAYAKSTFNFQDKVLIILFIIAIWGMVCTKLAITKKSLVLKLKYVTVFLLFTSVLSWNYLNNSMDNRNKQFENFQNDSENLVTGTIIAERAGINVAQNGYGLGMYLNIEGKQQYQESLINDENWKNGYSNWSPSICIDSNTYTQQLIQDCKYIQFSNGDQFQILNISDDGNYISIDIDTDTLLTEIKYGNLTDAQFLNSAKEKLPSGALSAYVSQYGLQGKIFRHLARYMDDTNAIANLKLICAITTSAVFVIIVFLIFAKYNALLAGCYLITFWLSPWIVNFARNLYWVEFTWFLPTAIGLFCAWKINNKRCRCFSYAATYISITLKCLCGYEYITSIMLGLITFLLADLIKYIIHQNKDKQKLLIKTIFVIGVLALCGFVTAICIHSHFRGNGNIMEGIKRIFNEDVLRRTYGSDLNKYDEFLLMSINASAWEVICKYFHFDTQIIVGIEGNLFPLLCIIPLIIFIAQQNKKRLNIEHTILYCVSFATTISWLFLAKAHSYVHTHMNYVLWYMGYIQVGFYIIIQWILEKITTTGE